jgi:hypothetical protein
MIEDNFNSYNSKSESTSGMITFEEYLQSKGEIIQEEEEIIPFKENTIVENTVVSSGMITFEEYLQSKGESKVESVNLTFDDLITVDEDSIPESNGMITFIEYLEMKNLVVSEDEIEELSTNQLTQPTQTSDSNEIGYTKKSLWDGYVQHVKFHAKKAPIINIQDPQYLDESRARYAEFLIDEQKRTWDKIYFFTPGGRAIVEEPEDECAVIGKAVIGKNKIC